MLAISTKHANPTSAFSMKISGESHNRSQRSNFRIFEASFHFADEFPSEFERLSENGDFYPRVN